MNIKELKEFALRLPDPAKTLILSQPDEMQEDELISKFFEWKKLLKIEPVKDDLKGKPRIVTQLMFEAQEGMKIGLGEADIMLLCTKIGKIYCYDRSSSINILQAAKEIKEIWDSLPVPQVKKAS